MNFKMKMNKKEGEFGIKASILRNKLIKLVSSSWVCVSERHACSQQWIFMD